MCDCLAALGQAVLLVAGRWNANRRSKTLPAVGGVGSNSNDAASADPTLGVRWLDTALESLGEALWTQRWVNANAERKEGRCATMPKQGTGSMHLDEDIRLLESAIWRIRCGSSN